MLTVMANSENAVILCALTEYSWASGYARSIVVVNADNSPVKFSSLTNSTYSVALGTYPSDSNGRFTMAPYTLATFTYSKHPSSIIAVTDNGSLTSRMYAVNSRNTWIT